MRQGLTAATDKRAPSGERGYPKSPAVDRFPHLATGPIADGGSGSAPSSRPSTDLTGTPRAATRPATGGRGNASVEDFEIEYRQVVRIRRSTKEEVRWQVRTKRLGSTRTSR